MLFGQQVSLGEPSDPTAPVLSNETRATPRRRLSRAHVLVALALLAVLVVLVVPTRFAAPQPDASDASNASDARQPLTVADLVGVTLDGGRFSGEELRGRLVLVDFWAVWCLPCIKAFPTLSALQDEHGEHGLQVLGVAVYSGTRDNVSEFLQEHDVSYPVVVGDDRLVARFGVIGFPSYFLFGPDGSLVETYVGEIESLTEELAAAIDRYLPHEAITADTPGTPDTPD